MAMTIGCCFKFVKELRVNTGIHGIVSCLGLFRGTTEFAKLKRNHQRAPLTPPAVEYSSSIINFWVLDLEFFSIGKQLFAAPFPRPSSCPKSSRPVRAAAERPVFGKNSGKFFSHRPDSGFLSRVLSSPEWQNTWPCDGHYRWQSPRRATADEDKRQRIALFNHFRPAPPGQLRAHGDHTLAFLDPQAAKIGEIEWVVRRKWQPETIAVIILSAKVHSWREMLPGFNAK